MPSDKKLAAAAAHTRQQADAFAVAVGNCETKVERAKLDLEAAEDALARAREKAAEKEAEAVAAEKAADGVDTFAFAGTAEVGVQN